MWIVGVSLLGVIEAWQTDWLGLIGQEAAKDEHESLDSIERSWPVPDHVTLTELTLVHRDKVQLLHAHRGSNSLGQLPNFVAPMVSC